MFGNRLAHISSMSFLSLIFYSFAYVFIALYLIDLGFDGVQTGFLLSLLALTSLFVALPMGIINDRLDIRYTILVGYILSFIFFYSIAAFPDFLLFIPLFFIGGMGFNILQISFRNYIFKDREPWHEGRKYGIFQVAIVLSSFAGTLLGMLLVAYLGFPLTLMITGVYFLFLIPLLFFLEPVKVARTRLIQYERDFLKPNNILLAAIFFLFATHWGAERTSYGLFMREVLGLDPVGMGLYASFTIIFLGIAAFVFGNRIDHRTNFRNIFIIGLVVSGLAHILMTVPEVFISFAFRSIHEAGDGLAGVAILFWLGRKFKKSRLGGDTGIFFVIMTIGEFTGSLIYGPIGFSMGYSWPLIISGITTIITAGLFLVLKRRLG